MKRLIFSVLTAFFLLTTAVSAQTYDRAPLWNAEIDALTEIDRKQTPPKEAVLFVGSSSIRLWTNLRQSFPRLNVINRGFGGSRLEDVNYYFERIVAPYAPKTIVLYAGDNDVNDGIAPEKVLADFQKFTALVRARFPRALLVYIAIKPSPSRWKIADRLGRTNELIRAEIKRDKRSVFADVWTPMLDAQDAPRPELFLEDRLHMNEKGYAIWRDVLENYLK